MKDLVVRKLGLLGMTLAVAGVLSGCGNNSQTETKRGAATTGLQPGDVVITCFDSVNPDLLQVIPLVPLEAATDLKWTDREALADGTFNSNNEAADQVIPVSGAIAAGTPIESIGPAAGLGIGDPDETIIIYQGTLPATGDGMVSGGSLLWGISATQAGAWATTRTDAVSELPTVLASANVALDEDTPSMAQHFSYDGPMTGTKAGCTSSRQIRTRSSCTRSGSSTPSTRI